jgi:hypothetical protein
LQLYKLTDSKGQTRNHTQWGNGITHELPEKPNPRLCSGDVLHAYKNINLAFLLNPIHAIYTNPVLYLAEGEIAVEDWGKVGCFGLTTVKEIEPLEIVLAFYVRLWPMWLALAIFIIGGWRSERGLR